jgi:hypothetical protein
MLIMMGTIRLVNKRKGIGPKPNPDEIVIDFDRCNKILGNRHYLSNPNDDEERARVIAAYRVDLEKDWEVSGPMYQAICDIVDSIYAGNKIAGACWCVPKPCHGDVIIEYITNVIRGED